MTIKRVTFLQELLAFMGLEGRLHLEWISSAEAQKFVQVIIDFTEKIRTLGPNPLPKYRGFQLLPSLRQGQSDWQTMLKSLGNLYVSGVSVDWSGFDRPYPRRKVALPTYPFDEQHY